MLIRDRCEQPKGLPIVELPIAVCLFLQPHDTAQSTPLFSIILSPPNALPLALPFSLLIQAPYVVSLEEIAKIVRKFANTSGSGPYGVS